MSNYKKIVLIVALVFAVILGTWFYYFWEYPLPERLPQETWTKVQIEHRGTDGSVQTWENPDLDAVVAALSQTKVRRDSSPSRDVGTHFLLTLYSEENRGAGPTVLYVQDNGKLHLAANHDLDHYQHYTGGRELYAALMALYQN